MDEYVGREELSIRAHESEFVRHYCNNYNLLMDYVSGKLDNKNPAIAEEIVQEVFMEVLFHWEEFTSNRYPERWLMNKAFEKINSFVKKENI